MSNIKSAKCPKCDKVRFKDIPKNRYFSLKSIESVETANLYRPDIEMHLNELICVDCYNMGNRKKSLISV